MTESGFESGSESRQSACLLFFGLPQSHVEGRVGRLHALTIKLKLIKIILLILTDQNRGRGLAIAFGSIVPRRLQPLWGVRDVCQNVTVVMSRLQIRFAGPQWELILDCDCCGG